jgi:hypothetical protein
MISGNVGMTNRPFFYTVYILYTFITKNERADYFPFKEGIMGLRVIGAGIGRTGTMSLKVALEHLGFDKCYHMEELAKNPAHVPLWVDAENGEKVDWDALFEGYQSAVDLPTYAFYSELMAQYPEARVILTLREPDTWYESASKTIFRIPPPAVMGVLRLMSLFIGRLKPIAAMMDVFPIGRRFFNNDFSKDNAIEVFNRHNDTVQRTVPPEKLLVYDVKMGWEPLCGFLEVPLPDKPFPHKNTREEFGSRPE